MDIGHVNNLLGEVGARLESLDPHAEEIETMKPGSDGSVSAAKAKLADLMAKLGANRSKANKVNAYGTK